MAWREGWTKPKVTKTRASAKLRIIHVWCDPNRWARTCRTAIVVAVNQSTDHTPKAVFPAIPRSKETAVPRPPRLEYLERFGPQTQRDLGGRLLLTSGAVTLLVDRLERLGLVRRRPHPSDRRATLVELMPDAALPELPEMRDYHRELLSAAQSLSPAARQEIVDLLLRLAAMAAQASDQMRARTAPRTRTRGPSRRPD